MLFRNNRLKKNLRGFQKKRVDLDRFVRDFYVENGLAYISCNVNEYCDVIDRYSVSGYEMLEPGLAGYIEQSANYIPVEYPILLEICGCRFSGKQKDTIEKTVADYYALKMGDSQMELDKNRQDIVLISVLTVIMALVYAVLSFIPEVPAVIRETLTIIFWVFLWTLVDAVVFRRRDMKTARTEAAQLASMKVVFKEKFEDALVKPEEEKAIIKEVFEDDVILPSNEW